MSPPCPGQCARACLAMHTRSSSRILQQVPSHYLWASPQRPAGLVRQEVLPPCCVSAAGLGLLVLGTRSDLCRAGVVPVPLPGAMWLCPSMSGSLRKCQQPFCQSQAQLAPMPSVGRLCQIPHPWRGSAALLGCRACFCGCWEQESRVGRGTGSCISHLGCPS